MRATDFTYSIFIVKYYIFSHAIKEIPFVEFNIYSTIGTNSSSTSPRRIQRREGIFFIGRCSSSKRVVCKQVVDLIDSTYSIRRARATNSKISRVSGGKGLTLHWACALPHTRNIFHTHMSSSLSHLQFSYENDWWTVVGFTGTRFIIRILLLMILRHNSIIQTGGGCDIVSRLTATTLTEVTGWDLSRFYVSGDLLW